MHRPGREEYRYHGTDPTQKQVGTTGEPKSAYTRTLYRCGVSATRGLATSPRLLREWLWPGWVLFLTIITLPTAGIVVPGRTPPTG